MKKSILFASAAVLMSGQAMAWEAGDLLARVGATKVSPDDGGNNLMLGNVDTGFDLTVGEDTQLGLNLLYFYTDNLAVELLAATPFTHGIDVVGVGKVADLTHLPPTVSANYYFTDPSSTLQVYAGLGLNYTFTYDEDFNATGASLGLDNLSVENSAGLAYQVGFDYILDDTWSLNASARYINIEATATMTADGSAAPTVPAGSYRSDVEVNPWVYTLAIGYKF